MCNDLERNLQRGCGVRAAAIHGDKDQRSREETLRGFKSGQIPLMVATDVAARGIDVKDVRAVVNYDFPGSVEDYVHRIGCVALPLRILLQCCRDAISHTPAVL